jgi:hypothetical protein
MTSQQQETDSDRIKKLAEAQTAAANALKAQVEAYTAAFKAQPVSSFIGEVTPKDKPGSAESMLLAAKAVETAAKEMVKKIVNLLPKQGESKTILLYAIGDIPDFKAYITFHAEIELVGEAFEHAKDSSKIADSEAEPLAEFARELVTVEERLLPTVLPAIGIGLEAINKLVGFVSTNYTVGSVEVKFEDSLLIHALAGAITSSNKNLNLQLPALYNPGAFTYSAEMILDKVKETASLNRDAPNIASRHEKISGLFTIKADKATDEKTEKSMRENAKKHKDAADAWKAAMGLYDSFLSKLIAADAKGAVPLVSVIQEEIIADLLLNENFLLLVKLHASGGAYYTKKSIWTLLGRMPFYHMGGIVASFVLFDGKAGTVLASGVVPIHGGFVKANVLQKKFPQAK